MVADALDVPKREVSVLCKAAALKEGASGRGREGKGAVVTLVLADDGFVYVQAAGIPALRRTDVSTKIDIACCIRDNCLAWRAHCC